MARGQAVSAKFARKIEQVGKLDPHITLHAWDGSASGHIFIGEDIHHRLLKTAGVIKNIMGYAQLLGDLTCVANILTGTAAAGAANRFAMIIELQSDTDRLCTRPRS